MVKLDGVSKHVHCPLLSGAAQHRLNLIFVQALQVLQGEHSIEALPAHHVHLIMRALPTEFTPEMWDCPATTRPKLAHVQDGTGAKPQQ